MLSVGVDLVPRAAAAANGPAMVRVSPTRANDARLVEECPVFIYKF